MQISCFQEGRSDLHRKRDEKKLSLEKFFRECFLNPLEFSAKVHESESEARNPKRRFLLQNRRFWEILAKTIHPCAVRCSSRRVCPLMPFPGLQHASRVNSNTSGAYSPHFHCSILALSKNVSVMVYRLEIPEPHLEWKKIF